METLFSVPGYPHLSVTEDGRVFSSKSNRWLAQTLAGTDRRPYVYTGKTKKCVHQLVALAFYGERPEGKEVRHLDGNKLNNHKDNLRYGTRSENQLDSVNHGSHSFVKVNRQVAEEIRRLHSLGWKSSELVKEFNLSKANVSKIVNNKIWRT